MFKINSVIVTESVILVSVILFRLILDASFLFYLDKQFNHTGFILNFSIYDYALSWIGLISIFLLLPKQNKKISEIAIQFMFVMIYIPFTSYFGLSDASLSWFFYFSLFWIFLGSLNYISFSFKFLKFPIYFSNQILFFLTGSIVFIIFGILFYFVDFRLNFDLYAVYQIRSENPTGHIPFAGYYLNWTAKVFLPFLLMYSVIKIKPAINLYSIVFSIMIFILFSITGHKAYLFIIPMLIGTVLLIKTSSFYFHLVIAISTISILGLIVFVTLGSDTIVTMIVRRTMLLPAQISFHYFDFFENQPIYLSNSVLSSIKDYPFEIEPAFLIGEKYYNKPDMSANNGIISDGFMQFGIIGIFMWSFVLFVILKLLDTFVNGKNNLILWPIILVGIKSFIDGALFTSLLTHGFLVMMLLCYLYPKLKNTSRSVSEKMT